VILAGVAKSDTESEVDFLSDKVLGLRIFPDSSGKMNRNVVEAGGSLLVVSQFTLYGDCRKGRRPSFDQAAAPQHAQALYDYFVEKVRLGPVPVETGLFQAMMEVHLVNQGPVTILMDTADRNRK
jgi:D-tyrosyl-tRNA(Tyr) deacylase